MKQNLASGVRHLQFRMSDREGSSLSIIRRLARFSGHLFTIQASAFACPRFYHVIGFPFRIFTDPGSDRVHCGISGRINQ